MQFEPHILATLGVIMAFAGVAVVLWFVTSAGTRRSEGRSESLLAPTLAVDTLDPDLRIAYMRTLVLDAKLQARSGLRGPAARAIGRELRRTLVGIQAARVRGERTSVDDVIALLDEAIAFAEQGVAPADGWSPLLAGARDLRPESKREIRAQDPFE